MKIVFLILSILFLTSCFEDPIENYRFGRIYNKTFDGNNYYLEIEYYNRFSILDSQQIIVSLDKYLMYNIDDTIR